MVTLRYHHTVEKNGELNLQNLPIEAGQEVEVLLLVSSKYSKKKHLTAKDILDSDLVGIWKDRQDISDSAAYARELREKSQNR